MDNKDELLSFLYEKNNWVEASLLAKVFHVTPRTIRNYVNKINSEYTDGKLVQSSAKGYRIDSSLYNMCSENKETEGEGFETPAKRMNYIIRKCLTSTDAVDFFTLADELFISESTLENDLTRIRLMLKRFDLSIHHEQNSIIIRGSERNKRKLISYLINAENYGNFMTPANLSLLVDHYNISGLYDEITHIFSGSELFINDYALNNIIIHLAVSIDRIKNKQVITEEVQPDKLIDTKEYNVAKKIAAYIEKTDHISINESELYHLALTVSSNTTIMNFAAMNRENLAEYVDRQYIDTADRIMRKVEERYYLEPFDDDFFIKFTIHVCNLFKRCRYNASAKNPITAKMKISYPFIYDIAVFIANELSKEGGLKVNEDEIAFLAFHIGAYFERTNKLKKLIRCVFIYADYYSVHQVAIDKILSYFSETVDLVDAIQIRNFKQPLSNIDMIISTLPLANTFGIPAVVVNMFITDSDINRLSQEINNIKLIKGYSELRKHINRFIDPRLFKKNFYKSNKYEMIKELAREACYYGYTNENFTQEVLERERLSSTSFGNLVAVPHSMEQNARKSFISVVLNDGPMNWGDSKVNIVVLIGVSKDDRIVFREIFDHLIDILSEPNSVHQIIGSRDYNEFINHVISIIKK